MNKNLCGCLFHYTAQITLQDIRNYHFLAYFISFVVFTLTLTVNPDQVLILHIRPNVVTIFAMQILKQSVITKTLPT